MPGIFDKHFQIPLAQMSLDDDAERTKARAQAKLNGIFHQRLHERTWHELATRSRLRLNRIFQPVGESYVFNLKITLQCIEFLAKRLPAITTAQRKPQIVSESLSDRGDLLRLITDGKNRVERIKKKGSCLVWK
jgi:hypothetical protein